MAAVFLFRAALIIGGPAGAKALAWVQGPGLPTGLNNWRRAEEILRNGESDEAQSAELSELAGTLISVATFEEPFEVRKAQVLWGRDGGMAGGTDDAVTTHHFVKLAGGVPTADWLAADFIAVEAALVAFWDGIKDNYTARTSLKQIRWYKAGPDIEPPQPPVRIVDPANPGTDPIANGQTPPQVAMSVTEKTTDAKAWGRFYLPAPSEPSSTTYGRMGAVMQADIADNADTMYEAFVTAGCPAVIYSTAKPERETAGGDILPAKAARALTVIQVQVDDLYDVIRSRRWKQPLLRLQRDVAGA
jgi:hypothetical protein